MNQLVIHGPIMANLDVLVYKKERDWEVWVGRYLFLILKNSWCFLHR